MKFRLPGFFGYSEIDTGDPPKYSWPAAVPMCPATTRYIRQHTAQAVGVQCKYRALHEGDHCGYSGPLDGDIFWPQKQVDSG